MEHLWAPWRNRYVVGEKKDLATLFRELAQSRDDRADGIVRRSKACFVVLNRFPYNLGHCMVVPYREVAMPAELSADESSDMWAMVNQTLAALKKAFNAPGFNVGMNLGPEAGAGIPNHLHVHVVPRWPNDANFLTAIAETRVHPGDLDSAWEMITRAWPGGSASPQVPIYGPHDSVINPPPGPSI